MTPSTYVWQNSGTDWHTLANWRVGTSVPTELPGVDDQCWIDHGSIQPIVSAGAVTIGALLMSDNAQLSLRQDFTIDCSEDVADSTIEHVNFEGAITLTIKNTSTETRVGLYGFLSTPTAYASSWQQVDVVDGFIDVGCDTASDTYFQRIDRLKIGGGSASSGVNVYTTRNWSFADGPCEIEVLAGADISFNARGTVTSGGNLYLEAGAEDSVIEIASGGAILFEADADYDTTVEASLLCNGSVWIQAGGRVDFAADNNALIVYAGGVGDGLNMFGGSKLKLSGTNATALIQGAVYVRYDNELGATLIEVSEGALHFEQGSTLQFSGGAALEFRVFDIVFEDNPTVTMRVYSNNDSDKIVALDDVECDTVTINVYPQGGYDPLTDHHYDLVSWNDEWISTGIGPSVALSAELSEFFVDEAQRRLRLTVV